MARHGNLRQSNLHGEASDLPIQAPTKYQVVINLKPQKRSAIDVASCSRADEVIE